MNRKQRRNIDKKMKSKMTDTQFKQFKQEAIDQTVELEVKKAFNNFSSYFGECFMEALRENKISDKRATKIFDEAFEKVSIKIAEIEKERGIM